MKYQSLKLIAFCGLFLSSSLISRGQDHHPKMVQIVYEAFSLPFEEAAALRRVGHTDKALYDQLIAGLKNGKVVQEKLLSTRLRSGQRATVSQFSEYIYPTEFDPPELPNSVGGGAPPEGDESTGKTKKPDPNAADQKAKVMVFPATPSTPSAFDSRWLGDRLEADGSISADGKYIDVRSSTDHVRLIQLDKWGKGLSELNMPRFSNQSINCSTTQRSGVPTLIGTISPPKESQKEGAEERVWFAFVTAKLIAVRE